MNDKHTEFISIGGLLPGLLPEDIRNGISLLRNRKLAEVFHRLNFIESYGTGIRRIFALYDGYAELPVIVVTPNSFKITLPNMNAMADTQKTPSVHSITPQMRTLLDYLKKHAEMTEQDIQSLLGIKRTRVYILTKKMIELGLIRVHGRGSKKKYTLA